MKMTIAGVIRAIDSLFPRQGCSTIGDSTPLHHQIPQHVALNLAAACHRQFTELLDRLRQLIVGDLIAQEGDELLIRTGTKSGTFRKTDVSTTSVAVLSMLNWMLRWYNRRGPKRAVQFAADFAELAIQGLVARPLETRKR